MRPRNEISERRLGFIMVVPTIAIIGGVALYPILNAFWLSLHHIQLQFPRLGRPFVGLGNYVDLFHDSQFRNALGVTTLFTLVTVACELVGGLALALMLNRSFWGRGLVRSAVLVPWAFTTVVAALLWQFIYNGNYGIANAIALRTIGHKIEWLSSGGWALVSMMIADVWKTTPFMALLLLAGLQTIPSDVYEAARIDGAGAVAQFHRITLPMLRPTILVALLFRTLDAFRVFDLVFVLTQGGPGNATESLSYLTYIKLFRQFDFGAGSALSVVTFGCVLMISFVFIRILGTRTN